ncbi:hypothetical protein BO71DRAFT_394799 [Aspergillus ellipticus CBS 707.79]|uniref:Major facilitator superfamily (MFS) profile domain-containing protein n=1 Tax=Aspergillus ellipticus CBS 707.79 TaxID=1448320 RepID=A0A319EE22_9EURO|nr:hypothetical protein BO71DRAFT_394799 [Aspergillus ellipticus CBS 707.79]
MSKTLDIISQAPPYGNPLDMLLRPIEKPFKCHLEYCEKLEFGIFISGTHARNREIVYAPDYKMNAPAIPVDHTSLKIKGGEIQESSLYSSKAIRLSDNSSDDTENVHNAMRQESESGARRPQITLPRLSVLLAILWTILSFPILDETMIATLLGPISTSFGALSNLSWIATTYLIGMSAANPISGHLADIFGRRNQPQGISHIDVLTSEFNAVQALDSSMKHIAQEAYRNALHVVFWITTAEMIIAALAASARMQGNKIPESPKR